MNLTKQERHTAEQAVFNNRGDGGARAIHTWLKLRREELNRQWQAIQGDELAAMQGEARCIDKLVQVIEHGPTVKQLAPEIQP